MKSPVYDFFEKIAPENIVTWVGLNTGKTALMLCWLTFLFYMDVRKNGENCVLARFLGLFGIKWKNERKRSGESRYDIDNPAYNEYDSYDSD